MKAMLHDISRRLLVPIHAVGTRFPDLARTLRRSVKLVSWTVTSQLRTHDAVRRRHGVELAHGAVVQPNALQIDEPLLPNRAQADAVSPPYTEIPNIPPPREDLREAFLARHGTALIHFPPVATPDVTVIIPVYKGLANLQTCLRSLTVHLEREPSFDVILIDDCPTEPVLWAVPDSGGLSKLENDRNLGFLLACNRAAASARGRILCFLHSDTIVSRHWLGSLVDALDEPGAALAGGMMLNVDGTIQDAGWRIQGNGLDYPLGRGSEARDGAHTYRRRVDCVTGACLAIRRVQFEEIGGFDSLYAPIFYGDFDLAFRLRARGLHAIYEPRSQIVHLGSVSYGTAQQDALFDINRNKFTERFANALRKQPYDTGDRFALRHGSETGPVILVVDCGIPQSDRHAGDVTIGRYLSLLQEAGWCVIFAPMDGWADGPAADALERLGIELIRAPRTIEDWLAENGRHVGRVLLSGPSDAEVLIGPVRAYTSAAISYYSHDLHHVRLQQEADLRGDWTNAAEVERARARDYAVFRKVDSVIAPSEEVSATIRRLVPAASAALLPPCFYNPPEIVTHDRDHFAPLVNIVFVGGFPHTPDVDAALFIAKDVMPLVWQTCPDARLVLAGHAPPPEVQALAGSRIIVVGQVPAIEPSLAQARVMLAAVRFGVGVKGKVVDALRQGVPVVTTRVGAEGIGIEPGAEAIVADEAAGLAEGVVTLLRDPGRCAALSDAGASLIRRRFSRAAARAALRAIFPAPCCPVCGSAGVVVPPDNNPREGFVCHGCFALGRAEALARVVLARYAPDGTVSLAAWARQKPAVAVHELGFIGGVAATLRGQPWFTCSEYFEDVPIGQMGPDGVRCEDVTRLTYANESFDLIISQDVMEHVADPVAGFAETARVLRPGGSHIFTIPQNRALNRSITRARLNGGVVEYLLPADYHGDPVRAEGALVFTEFGSDLHELLARAGLRLVEHEVPVRSDAGAPFLRVFEAIKLSDDDDRNDCLGWSDRCGQ